MAEIFAPGTKAENSLRFKPVEAFISTLTGNSEILKQIADECDYDELKQQNHPAETGFVYVDTEKHGWIIFKGVRRCMANYHLEISIINRGNGGSVARYVNYIGGYKVHDSYTGKTYYC